MISAILDALATTGSMAWQIGWSLVLGFLLASVVQAVVRRETVSRALGDDRPRTLAKAAGFGMASSSCSYAAVALARSLFRKGASFTAAIVFQIASTNLVIELGIILAILMGWQFTLAELVGGLVMMTLVALYLRLFAGTDLVNQARIQSEKGLAGSMEGHAAMNMSIEDGRHFLRRLFSRDGLTAVSHIYVMEWAAVLRDIVIGLVIAGAVAAWVPDSFWQTLFLTDHPTLAKLWGPIIGPVIAILSFVCSVGNVPLAAVLYSSGISFGGVVSFLFADLIILPVLAIYKKYYGTRMMLALLAGLYLSMVVAGYLVEALSGRLGLQPDPSDATIVNHGIDLDYTTVLNIAFLAASLGLTAGFLRTGGRTMLTTMGGTPTRGDYTENDDA